MNGRPVRLKVKEVLGINAHEPPRLPAITEIAGRRAGRLATVVPPSKRAHHHRAGEGRARLEPNRRHPDSLPRKASTVPPRSGRRRACPSWPVAPEACLAASGLGLRAVETRTLNV